MFITIITIIIFGFFMLVLIAGTNISGKSLKGSCGNSDDNPCTCSFLERTNCKNKIIQQ